jgi:hypothetical protein
LFQKSQTAPPPPPPPPPLFSPAHYAKLSSPFYPFSHLHFRSAQLLISSSLAVEISKLPPFESAIINSTPQPTRSHTPVSPLPWMQSPIISSIAASVSEPVQSSPRSRFRPAELPTKYQRPASPADDSSVLSKNAKSTTAHAAAGHDDEQVSVHRGCIPPKVRERCSMM